MKKRTNLSTKLDEQVDYQEEYSIWSSFLNSKELAVFYSGSIDTYTIQGIAEEAGQYEAAKKPDFTLFLESSGGNAALVKCFYPMMTSIGLKRIVGFSQTSSAAFQIMLECHINKMPVFIDPLCHVVIHRCISTLVTEERSDRIRDYNENWIKRFESVIDNMNDTIFDKIGKKFKRNYDAGMNVYLLGRDLIEVGLFQEYKKGVI